jgi:hypothetical protein
MSAFLESLLGLLPVAHADAAPLTAVGVDLTPLPGAVPPVRMRREEVDIHVFRGFAVVEAVFELENEGDATELDVGFPCLQASSTWTPPTGALSGFHVEVDGRPAPSDVRRLENKAFPFWMAWRQRFPARATARVAVRYWTALADYRGVSRAPFFYVLRTGRFWKGAIGEAVVRVHAAGVPLSAIREATPGGYAVDKAAKQLVWTFRDLVPDQDVCLLVSPLAARAASLGLELHEIVELNRAKPPAGTRVVVGGYLREDLRRGTLLRRDAEGLLLGERSRDTNVAIPESLPVFDEDRDRNLVGVPIRVPTTVTAKESVAPGFFSPSWPRVYVAEGRVAYTRSGGLEIEVDVLHHLSDGPVVIGDPLFPWVQGPIDRPRPFAKVDPENRWPETLRKAVIERGRP